MRMPLLGVGFKAKSAIIDAQQHINCYYELQGDKDKAAAAIYGTPGKTLFTTLGTGLPIRGIYSTTGSNSIIYAVSGTQVFTVNGAGTVTFVGSLNTSSGRVSMADNGSQLIIVDGVNGYIVTMATNTLVQITDVDFPNGATSVTYIDSYFVVEQAGTQHFWNSALNDGTNWNGLSFSSADSYPDPVSCVFADHGQLNILGTTTSEFWTDVGGANFPFQRISGSTATWGLAAKNSVVRIDNTIAWLGLSESGEAQVVSLISYIPTRISNHEVERLINSCNYEDATGLSYMVDGHPFYQLNFTSGNFTLLYDASNQVWTTLQSGLTGRDIADTSCNFLNSIILGDYRNDKLYKLDKNNLTENGSPIIRTFTLRHLFKGKERLCVYHLELDMEVGVGLQTGQGSDPMIMLQVSRNAGQTFGTELWQSIGKVGKYKTRVRWRRLGISNDFVFQFKLSDPVKLAVVAVDLMVEDGAS